MINVKNLKQSLTQDNIISILSALGADITKQSDAEMIFYSCCHHKDCLNHKPKLYYYTESQSFKCYSCGFGGDILALIQQVKDCNFIDALNYICDILHIDSGTFERKTNKNTYDWKKDLGKYIKKEKQEIELRVWDDNVLDFFDCGNVVIEDWVKEGISAETQQKYEIGWYSLHNSILIPCRDENNNLVGCRERFMNPEDCMSGKYKPLKTLSGEQYNFPVSYFFYGMYQNKDIIKRKREVWLVEGEKSVLKFDSWFNKDNVSLAMYGSNLSKEKVKQLLTLGVESVIIMVDNDFHVGNKDELKQFKKKVIGMYEKLKPFFKVNVCYNNQKYDGYKFSPCDFTREQFDVLYKERIKLNG